MKSDVERVSEAVAGAVNVGVDRARSRNAVLPVARAAVRRSSSRFSPRSSTHSAPTRRPPALTSAVVVVDISKLKLGVANSDERRGAGVLTARRSPSRIGERPCSERVRGNNAPSR